MYHVNACSDNDYTTLYIELTCACNCVMAKKVLLLYVKGVCLYFSCKLYGTVLVEMLRLSLFRVTWS